MKSWDGSERRHQNQEFEYLKGQINLLNQKVDSLTESKDGSHKAIIEMMGRHNETLYGNGRPGLTTVVSSLGETFRLHYNINRWLFGIIIAIIIGIIGYLGKLAFNV